MKKQLLFAAVAGLTLVSAHPGPDPAIATGESRSGYPPCSRTVTDRCIQLHERGVRSPANLARNAAPAAPAPVVAAGAVPPTAPAPIVRAIRPDGDDIDVAYAGDVLQAPSAGRPPAVVHRHRPDGPTRVVVLRQKHRAHAITPQAVAHAAHAPAHPPRVQVAQAAAPRAMARIPRRQVSMRVRRAGERG
jgi:hypothetical protein